MEIGYERVLGSRQYPMDELLPCPFCGSKAVRMTEVDTREIGFGIQAEEPYTKFFVRCLDCQGRAGGSDSYPLNCFPLSEDEARAAASRKWNMRKTAAAQELADGAERTSPDKYPSAS